MGREGPKEGNTELSGKRKRGTTRNRQATKEGRRVNERAHYPCRMHARALPPSSKALSFRPACFERVNKRSIQREKTKEKS